MEGWERDSGARSSTLMEQDFTEEEADIIIEGLRYVLHGGKGVVLRGEETDD